jgi:CheY-like chemotaxis protein
MRETATTDESGACTPQPLRSCARGDTPDVTPCTVFVVEDDVDTRDMLKRFLELEGFHVEMAANGQQALDRLHAGVQPCVIVLDLMMPVMDGWQFRHRQVQDQALAAIPVIVVSAAGRNRITDVDADAYLTKPVDLDQLLDRVNQYCAH